MQVRKLGVRVERDEAVAAVYARDLEGLPDALFLRIGSLQISGRPADIVEVLGRALEECWSAWAGGYRDVVGDGQGDAAGNPEKVTALPPLVEQPVVDDALSRIAPWATAKPLVLDGGAASADPLRFSGGGIRESFYLIRDGEKHGA